VKHGLCRRTRRIGSGGQMRVDLFESHVMANDAHDKLVKDKGKRGYQ